MSAMRPEPADVQCNDDRPARFVWRGRLYTVLSIVERPDEAAAQAAVLGAEVAEHEHLSAGVEGRGDRDGWRCWRVTASPGKNVPPVGFRLCHDQAADRWLLSRDGA